MRWGAMEQGNHRSRSTETTCNHSNPYLVVILSASLGDSLNRSIITHGYSFYRGVHMGGVWGFGDSQVVTLVMQWVTVDSVWGDICH